MPTTNNTSNHGLFDEDKNGKAFGSDAAGDAPFNGGLSNTDNGLLSAALNPPAGAGDPPAAPTTSASIATLADYLVNGYWAFSGYKGTGPRHFNHNTISVNITDLTAAEQTIAQTVLALWHDVANVNFTYTSGAADITYINDGSGKAVTSYSSVTNGAIASSTVNISSDWSGGASTGNYSYFFQTYVHETGHALGLGHQGPYNNTGDYNTQALWTNDTWRWSVMSYFSQNNYGSDTYDYVLTPEMADIYAIQSIYGVQTTRTGDTTYGFNSNAGSFYNFSTYSGTPAFTIYDSGGNDTLDASGYSSAQTIDLTPGNWSSIGGYTDNIGIYLTTTIENAKGGSGADTIYGNDANNSLYGNGGNDTMKGGGGADFLSGDAGDDTLNGGDGNDSLYGGDGNDSLKGAGGADYLNGGNGVDTVTYDYSSTAVSVNLSTGVGSGGDAQGDTYYSIENINGTSGNDVLTGNSDANTIRGNDGNDVISGFLGNDVLDGGNGTDTLDYQLDRGVSISLNTTAAQNTGGSGTDTVSNFENLNGSYFNDTLTGNGGANVIQGIGGSDTINGLGGNDTIYAGAPNTYLTEASSQNNSTIGTAISLDGLFVQSYSPIIQNSTSTPHATVVATTDGSFEYFKFTVTAGAQAVFDIDQTVGVDTFLRLFGTDGTTVLATQDDYSTADPGSAPMAGIGTLRDSYLSYTFATAGTYYLRVDSYPGSAGPAAGSQFTLNVSLPGATLATPTAGSVLNGGSGADTIYGSSGNDRFVDDDGISGDFYSAGAGIDTVDYSSVTFVGASAIAIDLSQQRGTYTGNSTPDILSGFENVEGSQGGETIVGNSLANVLNGNGGDDTIDGFLGNDTMNGGAGIDTLSYALDKGVNVSLAITVAQNTVGSGVDTVSGFENLTGSYFNDTLTGDAGNNVIRGGGGSDHINGGAGNDTLYSGATNATISKPQSQNNSSIGTAVNLDGHFGLQDSAFIANATTIPHATVTATASGNYEYYSFSVASGATVTFDVDQTGSNVDTIIRLFSTDGSTQLALNDDAALDPGSDNGHDSALTYTFATGGVYYLRVDSYPSTTPLAIGSTYTLNVSLNSAVVTTVGGGSTLSGGTGDDSYYLVNTGDTVVENANEGTDTVYTSFSYTLGPNVENLVLTGSGNINGTGNALANAITGNSGNNAINGNAGADTMTGGAGDDTYYVDDAGDKVIEAIGGGSDTVYASVSWSMAAGQEIEYLRAYGAGLTSGISLGGNELNNTLIGGSGNDYLAGGAGADSMSGGAGNDTYYVDNISDKVTEAVGGGTDNVYSSVSWSMAAGQEIEYLRAYGVATTSGVSFTGNEFSNYLIGGSGNDYLNGGAGADTLSGGAGNDTYYVDNAGDKVLEAVGGGSDNVYATVNWSMAAGQEIEYLRAYGAGATLGVTLGGNELDNTLIGGSGNDVLNGAAGNDVLLGNAGADTMTGGAGNDTYYVDNASDKAIEAVGGGTDTVYASVNWSMASGQEIEYLRAYGAGATSGVSLTGNELGNYLIGGAGNDVLNGGAGNDTLAGGGGQDTFLFDTPLVGNVDTITDFASNETIQLDRSIFTALTTLGTLSAASFFTGAAAHDTDDRIIYNSATGNLFYDSDGTGATAAVQFAHLNGNPAVSNTNFTVVA